MLEMIELSTVTLACCTLCITVLIFRTSLFFFYLPLSSDKYYVQIYEF